MFGRLRERGERLAEARAGQRRARVAARLDGAGLAARVEGEAVVVEGRGLGRRMALDPALRWRVAEAVDER